MVFFIGLGFLQWRKVQADLIQNSVGFIFHFFPAWVALSVYEAYWGLDEKPFENVVATSRLHPTRPTIDVLIDPRGRRLPEPRQIDLQDEPILYIVDPAIEEGVLGGR